jgi:hypothetical protein
MQFLSWLEATGISQHIQYGIWAYPVILCAHSVGMAMVVGIVLMLNLRVLGFPEGIPIQAFSRLLSVAWLGFYLNAISGVLLFMPEATKLAVLWTFQLKLALIVAGGISVWLLWRTVEEYKDADHRFSRKAKIIAIISTLFWLGAITSGRYIAYTLPVT